MSSLTKRPLTPQQKAAAVVISLGVEKASEVYKYLDQGDLEKLTYEIAMLRDVPSEETLETLTEFHDLCVTQQAATSGGLEYAKTVFERAFGAQAANSMVERIQKNLKTKAFEFVRRTDTKNLLSIMQAEKPRTIALILSYMTPNQASEILMEFDNDTRVQVVENVAKIESVSPKLVKVVEETFEKQFEFVLNLDYTKVGGVDYVADIMNYIDRSNEKSILGELDRIDQELSTEIRNKMFVFEDIVILSSMDVQKFLREIDLKDLTYAIKGAGQEVKQVIFDNVSSRQRESIQSELEYIRNVRMRDVEEAQQKIVAVIRRLEEEGEIIISKGGKDEIIA